LMAEPRVTTARLYDWKPGPVGLIGATETKLLEKTDLPMALLTAWM